MEKIDNVTSTSASYCSIGSVSSSIKEEDPIKRKLEELSSMEDINPTTKAICLQAREEIKILEHKVQSLQIEAAASAAVEKFNSKFLEDRFERQLKRLENEIRENIKIKSEKEYILKNMRKYVSLFALRLHIQDLEDDLRRNHIFPPKQIMYQELIRLGENLSDNSWLYIKMYYFLKVSTSRLAVDIRNLLVNSDISVDDFCSMITTTCRLMNMKVHYPILPLSKEELIDGLKEYGFTDIQFLQCVDLLEEIRKRPLSSGNMFQSNINANAHVSPRISASIESGYSVRAYSDCTRASNFRSQRWPSKRKRLHFIRRGRY